MSKVANSQQIIIARDGLWPMRWSWTAFVPIVEQGPGRFSSTTHTMHGEAFSKRGARQKAERAIRTLEVAA